MTPMWLLRVGARLFFLGMGVAARIPRARYARFFVLPYWCTHAVARGKNARAAAFAQELLTLAAQYSDDWNYGNALHHAHLVLGRVALAAGDRVTAGSELLEAGRTPGSPQLNSFGPNMQLAADLLAVGDHGVVIQYFDLCRAFWTMGGESLDRWSQDVAEGRSPEFGTNLVY